MTIPSITALPTAPQRTDAPATFVTRADAFVAALSAFGTQANASIVGINNLAVAGTLSEVQDTSTSSIAIGTGEKVFTITAGKSFVAGMTVLIADSAAPSANALMGTITSYSGTTLTMAITSVIGSGTKTSWVMFQTSTGGATLTSNTFTGTQDFTGATVLGIDADPILGFANKSSWADGEQISIALDPSASAIAKAHVSVYEEVPQTDVTNSIWDVITNDLGFTLVDSAYSVTLTPAATTGGSIEFTLGSGSWASTDIGKVIKNKSAGEAGEARVISVASGVATCKITVDFTNTDAIASGDWEMYSGEFTSGSFELSSSVQDGVTAGTPAVFESAITIYISVTMLTSTKAIVAYRDNGNSDYGTACILDVSGSTITAGTPVVFESATTNYISVAMLTSTKAIVAYRDDGNSSYGTACILDVSGSTITAGTAVVFESASTLYTSVTMLTSTKAIVAYRDNGNSSYGTTCILDVSGSTITAGTPVVFESATTNYISVAMLTSTKAIVTYQDDGNSDYGTSAIIDTETALYVTDQHVSAISGADTVDTTFYTDLNSVTATETLNSQTANYVFSFNPTLTSSVVTGGSFIVIGNGETAARTIASSLASVHGGVDGTWYYNSNATYASETWASSTINTTAGAVEQAQTVAANNMSGTDVGNVADGNWPAFGTKFALGIVLKSTSTSATPSVDKVLFDYDANVLNQISYGYEIDMPSTDLVRVTAPSSGGPRNARVYISK